MMHSFAFITLPCVYYTPLCLLHSLVNDTFWRFFTNFVDNAFASSTTRVESNQNSHVLFRMVLHLNRFIFLKVNHKIDK